MIYLHKTYSTREDRNGEVERVADVGVRVSITGWCLNSLQKTTLPHSISHAIETEGNRQDKYEKSTEGFGFSIELYST